MMPGFKPVYKSSSSNSKENFTNKYTCLRGIPITVREGTTLLFIINDPACRQGYSRPIIPFCKSYVRVRKFSDCLLPLGWSSRGTQKRKYGMIFFPGEKSGKDTDS